MNTNRPFQVVPPDGGAKRRSVRILIDGRVDGQRGPKAGRLSEFVHYLIKPLEPQEIFRLVETFQGMSPGSGTASA